MIPNVRTSDDDSLSARLAGVILRIIVELEATIRPVWRGILKRHLRLPGFARYRCARTTAIGYESRGRRRGSHSSQSGGRPSALASNVLENGKGRNRPLSANGDWFERPCVSEAVPRLD